VQQQWDRLLNALQVATPDRGIDLLVNRWLVYQVWLAACGPARRFTNPAERTGFAINCRM
jgi:cellobiose phosphorylase